MANIAKIDDVALASVAKLMGRAKAAGDDVMGVIYPSVGSIVQSVQQVEITVTATATSNTAIISSVDTTQSIILPNWQRQSSTIDDPDHLSFGLTLTNATTVTATRSVAAQEATISATVLEFVSGTLTSNQSGTIVISSPDTTNTDTISSITTSRSLVVWNGDNTTEDISSDFRQTPCTLSLTNSTTVTAERPDGTDQSATSYYSVIEFASGVTDQVQEVEITVSGSATSNTATITSVDTSRSVVFPGGFRGGTDGGTVGSPYRMYAELTNATTVTGTRDVIAVGGNDAGITATVVEFATGKLTSVQRGVATIATTDVTKDVTISSIATSTSAVCWLGYSDGDSSRVEPEDQYATVKILDSTTLRFERATTSAFDLSVSYEVWEF